LAGAHNLLDPITVQGSDPLSVLWYVLHQQNFMPIYNRQGMIAFIYPIIPWLGLMILGYCFGTFYKNGFDPGLRKKWLLILGIVSISLFIVLRSINGYGDPEPWSEQKNFTYTFLSFLNVTKYP